MRENKQRIPTLLGLFAIFFWSTNIAFSRSVTEKTGALNAGFFIMLGGGIFLLILLLLIYRKAFFQKVAGLPLSYYYKVGIYLVAYMVLFYIAVGEAASREAVITVGIINYLWPGLVFLFSVPILKNKARYGLLFLGILAGFGGTTAAVLSGAQLSVAELTLAFRGNVFPYLCAFIAALLWGFYSNITKKFQVKEDIVVLPLLFLLSAMVILLIQLLKGETPHLELAGSQYWEFAYIVIFPVSLAYLSWESAMKRGKKELIAAMSYAIPVVSTLISGYYLGVPIGFGFGLAALLVVIGALLCKWSIISAENLDAA